MPIQPVRWDALAKFLPEGTLPLINGLLSEFNIKLILTLPRNTLLGYYKPPHKDKQHIITINSNLNAYMFFVVLLHEIAHMKTYTLFGNSVKPHGREWQREFSKLLHQALHLNCFPDEIQVILHRHIVSPTILRSCMDHELTKLLRKWDINKNKHLILVEQIPIGGRFEDTKGRQMEIVKKQRSRFLCKQLHVSQTRFFLYPAIMEVKLLAGNTVTT